VHDLAVAAIANAVDLFERPALGDFLDGEIELGASDEVDRLRRGERSVSATCTS
jgi:hypothetical protein